MHLTSKCTLSLRMSDARYPNAGLLSLSRAMNLAQPVVFFPAKVCLFSADHRFDDMSTEVYARSDEAGVLLHLTLRGGGIGAVSKKCRKTIACREKNVGKDSTQNYREQQTLDLAFETPASKKTESLLSPGRPQIVV